MTTAVAVADSARRGTVLIIYATTEGHTAKIGHYLAEVIAKRGLNVDLYNSADLPKRFTVTGYDRIFVAGSVHAGQYQDALARFAKKHIATLNKTHTMFVSVSLSAAGGKDEKEEARVCAWKFVTAVGWEPTVVLSVAGALRFTQYDFLRSWMAKRVAAGRRLKASGTDDVEFTNWEALERAAGRFVSGI
jgi:menaquinone-dependent protoporphyrinogen oxidase